MAEFSGRWFIKTGKFLSGGAPSFMKRCLMKFGCTASILSVYCNFSFSFLDRDLPIKMVQFHICSRVSFKLQNIFILQSHQDLSILTVANVYCLFVYDLPRGHTLIWDTLPMQTGLSSSNSHHYILVLYRIEVFC